MSTLLRFDDSVDIDHPLYERYVRAVAGSPGLCPKCDHAGVVDSVDRATYAQNQHCAGCGYRWQYRFEPDGQIIELRELAGRRLDLLAPSAHDVGAILDLRDDPDGAEAPKPVGRGWWRR